MSEAEESVETVIHLLSKLTVETKQKMSEWLEKIIAEELGEAGE